MNSNYKVVWNTIFFILSGFLLIQQSCSSTEVLNDFFGIQMHEKDADEFKISSYTRKGGANYYSNSRMNPQIFAWAELEMQFLKIKIVNLTESIIPINYNSDSFIVVTEDGERHGLIKSDRIDYPSEQHIKTHKSVEFYLELPTEFWQTFGVSSSSFIQDFWRGEGSKKLVTENITMIIISLAGETSINLKPIS